MGNSELSPEAQSDLIEIWSYIAQYNEEAANNLIDKIYQKSQVLADSPYIQGKRTLFLQCLRHKGFSYYLVLLLKFKTLAT